jgi:hypothetical protein
VGTVWDSAKTGFLGKDFQFKDHPRRSGQPSAHLSPPYNAVNIQFMATTQPAHVTENPHHFTTNMKWRSRPPDFREEKMQQLCLKAPASVMGDYLRLFVNRRAYTLQSNRPRPESPAITTTVKDRKTRQGLSLTLDTIRRHLEGEITIGLYSINPATQCSKWVAIDADYEEALADLDKLSFYLRQDGVESALENSHRGGHLWIFLAEPLPARNCRIYVCDLVWWLVKSL